ncbi:hypothetical protein ZWY2020_011029 [Hordeum vulgare]|nr:hypothetical protein ZWY2020_011029 [Hordeum vulgare]
MLFLTHMTHGSVSYTENRLGPLRSGKNRLSLSSWTGPDRQKKKTFFSSTPSPPCSPLGRPAPPISDLQPAVDELAALVRSGLVAWPPPSAASRRDSRGSDRVLACLAAAALLVAASLPAGARAADLVAHGRRAEPADQVSVWHKLDHPNVTKFIGAIMGAGDLNIQTEDGNIGIPSNVCCVIVEYLAGGDKLSYFHLKKIVHRDVKTENMLLDKTRTFPTAANEWIVTRQVREQQTDAAGPETAARAPLAGAAGWSASSVVRVLRLRARARSAGSARRPWATRSAARAPAGSEAVARQAMTRPDPGCPCASRRKAEAGADQRGELVDRRLQVGDGRGGAA